MTTDVWLPVPGYEGHYEVSSRGCFRNLKTKNETFGHRQKSNGYHYINLCVGGRSKNYRAHVLVLQTFTGHRPPGLQVRHLDGNRSNNAVSNLAWGTPRDNHDDSVAHGTYSGGYVGRFFEEHPNAKFSKASADMLREMSEDFYQWQLAKIFGVTQSAVCRLLQRLHPGRPDGRPQANILARKERQMGRQAT